MFCPRPYNLRDRLGEGGGGGAAKGTLISASVAPHRGMFSVKQKRKVIKGAEILIEHMLTSKVCVWKRDGGGGGGGIDVGGCAPRNDQGR